MNGESQARSAEAEPTGLVSWLRDEETKGTAEAGRGPRPASSRSDNDAQPRHLRTRRLSDGQRLRFHG